jgi:hypothetical protein
MRVAGCEEPVAERAVRKPEAERGGENQRDRRELSGAKKCHATILRQQGVPRNTMFTFHGVA